jgi:proline iminopeptidase
VNWTASAAAVDQMVDVDGVRLYTRRIGGGPPVVVLHGGPGAHHDYLLPQYDLLARRRTLLYYDQRGGGRSPIARDTPAGWHEHVADLESLREQWRLDRLTLLGYSWGGLLAVLYALEHPERIERLTLVCPAPVAAEWRDDFQRRLAARAASPWIVEARAALQMSGLRLSDPEKYRRKSFALSVAGYFRDPSIAEELTPFRVTQRSEQAVWESLGRYDLRDRLRATFSGGRTPPSLVIAGTFDPLPIEAARELAGRLATTAVELATGHVPHVEATQEFVRTLDGFLPHD